MDNTSRNYRIHFGGTQLDQSLGGGPSATECMAIYCVITRISASSVRWSAVFTRDNVSDSLNSGLLAKDLTLDQAVLVDISAAGGSAQYWHFAVELITP
jgi:hypothetical protein